MSQRSVSVKVRYNDDTRRFQLNVGDSWEAVKQRLITTFGVGNIRVKYMDEENDEISLDSQVELDLAVKFAKENTGILKLSIEDLSIAKDPEVNTATSSFEDFSTCRLKNKKIWKNEKKLKKERKRYYAALAEEVGESKKELSKQQEAALLENFKNVQEAPEWFRSAFDKFSKETVNKILEQLEGAVVAAIPAPVTTAPAANGHHNSEQYCHYSIVCDGCNCTIVGIRYKCGNCVDYDLCEQCEPLGIHDDTHVFIKIRKPTPVASGTPLLPRLLYEQDSVEHDGANITQKEEEVAVLQRQSSSEFDSMTEDLDSLNLSPKGHRKCLDAKFVSDVDLPDNSFVYMGVPFAKSWLVRNTGSKQWRDVKLVHKEGHMPVNHQVLVPNLQPGEEGRITVDYSPIGFDVPENKLITSSWRFVHKDKTVFGDELWLSVFGLKKIDNEDVASSELFDIVESPTVSLVSLATGEMSIDEDILNARGCPIVNDRDDVSSIASDDSFVVVIPDCFDPGVPLLDQSPKPTANTVQQQARPTVEEQPQQQPDVQESSVNLMTFEEPRAVRPTGLFDTTTVVSKPAVLESAKPPPVTPKQMFTNPRTHIWGKNPFKVAAGFIDGAIHQFDTHVGQPSGVYGTTAPKVTTVPKQQQSSTTNQPTSPTKQPSAPPMTAACNDTTGSDDEEFKDCEFEPFEPAVPKSKPSCAVHFEPKDTYIPYPIPAQSSHPPLPVLGHQPPLYPTLPVPADNTGDVARLLQSRPVQYQPPPPWTPRQPETPMQQLMSLGFGNRSLNANLLHKHSNNIQAVVNELLDGGH